MKPGHKKLTGELVRPEAEAARDFLTGLLLCTAEGNHQAFSEFYRHTSGQVAGLVRRVVFDRKLSEEVVQEVFIVVWQDAAARRNPGAAQLMSGYYVREPGLYSLPSRKTWPLRVL